VSSYRSRTEPLPVQLDQVTPEWLTRTLQLRYPDVAVRDLQIVKVISGHTTKVRLKLDLNDAGRAVGIPEQVCLKANLSGDPLSNNACVVEAHFYRYVREDLIVPAPVAYYADWDDTDGREQGLVLMEDLAAEGGKFGGSTEPVTIDQAKQALIGFADLHSGWWGSSKLDQNSWLVTSMAPGTIDAEQYRYLAKYIEANVHLPERVAMLPKWFLDEPARLSRAFDTLTAHEQRQTGPHCLIHGDAHLGNTYVRPDGTRLFIDWQLARRGRPWRDITYFLIGSLRIEDRRAADRELLQFYCDQLARRRVAVPSFDHVWNEYRLWPIWGMVSWMANTDAWGQITMPALERFYTAAADLETLKLIEAQ
jgi:thiamine kinase-like enzyme